MDPEVVVISDLRRRDEPARCTPKEPGREPVLNTLLLRGHRHRRVDHYVLAAFALNSVRRGIFPSRYVRTQDGLHSIRFDFGPRQRVDSYVLGRYITSAGTNDARTPCEVDP